MTKVEIMEERRQTVLSFIKEKGVVRQTEINKEFRDIFLYTTETSYRVAISDILRSLETRGHISKKVDPDSNHPIPTNLWTYDGNTNAVREVPIQEA